LVCQRIQFPKGEVHKCKENEIEHGRRVQNEKDTFPAKKSGREENLNQGENGGRKGVREEWRINVLKKLAIVTPKK